MIRKDQDAYGAEIMAAYKAAGHDVPEIIERNDGYVDVAVTGPAGYFSDHTAWHKQERLAMKMASGRVLDIGCGAGRFALYLQSQGLSVTAIDNSPGAIRVCKLRGVKTAMVRSISEIARFNAQSFDTIIMMGNNFGLFGGREKAKRLLRQMFRITTKEGRIIADATDPYQTREPDHLEYLKRNRSRGRMSGQLRLRVRHKKVIGPWFDYLFASQKEMREILEGTGWEIKKVFAESGPRYVAVMVKASSQEK